MLASRILPRASWASVGTVSAALPAAAPSSASVGWFTCTSTPHAARPAQPQPAVAPMLRTVQAPGSIAWPEVSGMLARPALDWAAMQRGSVRWFGGADDKIWDRALDQLEQEKRIRQEFKKRVEEEKKALEMDPERAEEVAKATQELEEYMTKLKLISPDDKEKDPDLAERSSQALYDLLQALKIVEETGDTRFAVEVLADIRKEFKDVTIDPEDPSEHTIDAKTVWEDTLKQDEKDFGFFEARLSDDPAYHNELADVWKKAKPKLEELWPDHLSKMEKLALKYRATRVVRRIEKEQFPKTPDDYMKLDQEAKDQIKQGAVQRAFDAVREITEGKTNTVSGNPLVIPPPLPQDLKGMPFTEYELEKGDLFAHMVHLALREVLERRFYQWDNPLDPHLHSDPLPYPDAPDLSTDDAAAQEVKQDSFDEADHWTASEQEVTTTMSRAHTLLHEELNHKHVKLKEKNDKYNLLPDEKNQPISPFDADHFMYQQKWWSEADLNPDFTGVMPDQAPTHPDVDALRGKVDDKVVDTLAQEVKEQQEDASKDPEPMRKPEDVRLPQIDGLFSLAREPKPLPEERKEDEQLNSLYNGAYLTEDDDMEQTYFSPHLRRAPSRKDEIEEAHKEIQRRADILKASEQKERKLIVRKRKVDEQGRAWGRGSRKAARAVAYVEPGPGRFYVNNMPAAAYFTASTDYRVWLMDPLITVDAEGRFDVRCWARGGGKRGQAGACRMAITKALLNWNPEWRPELRKYRLVTTDRRKVERKKPGQPKARKKFQWVKR